MRAIDLVFEVEPQYRLRLFELIDFAGRQADSWKCLRCDGWGVFTDDQIVFE